MLLQIKVYLLTVLYFFGALFMILFPPRNFVQSGTKTRSVRSVDSNITISNKTIPKYIDASAVLSVVERFARDDPDAVSLVRLAPATAENRTIIALELRSDKYTKKPGILIVGAINAMAWGSPKALLDLAEKLLYNPSYQTPFFNDYDWYLIPCGNPDGLHFTQNLRSRRPLPNREWSKNLTARASTRPAEWHKNVETDFKDDVCFGTNINRNFAYHWQDDVHKTPERCSQHYPGIKPFSTAEAQAIRHYVDKLGDAIHLAIHLHASFVPKKEYILYPYRYSLRQHTNYQTLQDIGEYAARQARLSGGRLYEVHQGSSDAQVAGTFSDYVAGVVGVDLVYIVKPYHHMFPNDRDKTIDVYVKKSIAAVLGLVRGWRSSTKLNTLSFFGRDVEF